MRLLTQGFARKLVLAAMVRLGQVGHPECLVAADPRAGNDGESADWPAGPGIRHTPAKYQLAE
jgi:hypothetical protein